MRGRARSRSGLPLGAIGDIGRGNRDSAWPLHHWSRRYDFDTGSQVPLVPFLVYFVVFQGALRQ